MDADYSRIPKWYEYTGLLLFTSNIFYLFYLNYFSKEYDLIINISLFLFTALLVFSIFIISLILLNRAYCYKYGIVFLIILLLITSSLYLLTMLVEKFTPDIAIINNYFNILFLLNIIIPIITYIFQREPYYLID